MSWGTMYNANIFLSRTSYETEDEVRNAIDELTEQNQDYKERMLMLMVGGVNVVNTKDCEGNECDGVDIMHMKFTELLTFYTENEILIYKLELLLNNFGSKEIV